MYPCGRIRCTRCQAEAESRSLIERYVQMAGAHGPVFSRRLVQAIGDELRKERVDLAVADQTQGPAAGTGSRDRDCHLSHKDLSMSALDDLLAGAGKKVGEQVADAVSKMEDSGNHVVVPVVVVFVNSGVMQFRPEVENEAEVGG